MERSKEMEGSSGSAQVPSLLCLGKGEEEVAGRKTIPGSVHHVRDLKLGLGRPVKGKAGKEKDTDTRQISENGGKSEGPLLQDQVGVSRGPQHPALGCRE